MIEPAHNPEVPVPEADRAKALGVVEAALRGLRFGQVTIVVQDGVVVQVERTERTRLRRAGGRS